MMGKPKPSIDKIVTYLKGQIPNCLITDEEIKELKLLYPNVTYKDINRVFHQAIKNHAMQPISFINRQLRLFRPSGDPFNTQVNQRVAYGKRIEKGTDWQAKYAEIRAKRMQEEQQYDQRHGAGSWHKKQDQERQQIHLGFIELEKHTATTPQQKEAKDYDFRSDKDKAWYDNLIQGVFDEIKAEEQRRKEERQKELAKKRERAEARRELKKLAKNV